MLIVRLWVIHYLEEQGLDIMRLPRKVIIEHLEDDDSKRPDIALIGVMVF